MTTTKTVAERARALRPEFMTFELGGFKFPLFAHHYNCGHPPAPMTERSAELGIADLFLATVARPDVIEIGAVTPYYWPHRVIDVCDPTDPHELVNIRRSLFDVDLTGRTVLSISTLEHIGLGDYDQVVDASRNVAAWEKLFAEAKRFLVIVPGGYNKLMEEFLFNLDVQANRVSVRALVRDNRATNQWEERSALADSALAYEFGARCLLVVSRGTFLEIGLDNAIAEKVSRLTKRE